MAEESELFSRVEKNTSFGLGSRNKGRWNADTQEHVRNTRKVCIAIYLRLCADNCAIFRRAVQRRQRFQDIEGNKSNLAIVVPTLPPAL